MVSKVAALSVWYTLKQRVFAVGNLPENLPAYVVTSQFKFVNKKKNDNMSLGLLKLVKKNLDCSRYEELDKSPRLLLPKFNYLS